VPLARELELDAVVDETFALQPLTRARRHEQVDDRLLQDTRPHARLDVLAAPVLEDDAVDVLQVEQVRERETCRPGPDDRDLRARCVYGSSSSSSTRCAIANAPFAAGTPQ
jgi:hypothetical protein